MKKNCIRYRNFSIWMPPASAYEGFLFWKKNSKLGIDYLSYSSYPTTKQALSAAKKSIDRDWQDHNQFK